MIEYETVLLSIAILAGLVVFAFWGWMIVHCLKNRELGNQERLLWLLFLVVGKLVGAGAYYFLRHRQGPPVPAPTA